jgi:hypothetical protein
VGREKDYSITQKEPYFKNQGEWFEKWNRRKEILLQWVKCP